MATYSDFLRITNRDGLRRVYYVSGEEIVLREQVLERIKRDLGLGPGATTTVYLDDTPEGEAWLAADAFGLDDSPRLVVFRSAQLLADYDRLLHWADYRGAGAVLRNVILVLMADAPEWPTTYNHKGEQVYHRSDVRDALVKWRSCMVVTCQVKSSKAAAEAISEWLHCPSGEVGTPEWLYTWLGGDLAACRDAAMAIEPFRIFLDQAGKTYRVLDLLRMYVKPSPRSEFITCLESMNKPQALEAAVQVPRSQIRGTISWLAADLEVLTRVRRVQVPGLGNQEVANRLRLHRLRVDTLRPYARYYDPNKSAHCSQVLAHAESIMQSGANEGVLELVTALW